MSVIEEVKDFADDVKKGIGDKGFYLLIAAAGAFGLYNLLKDNNGGSDYVAATGYASYPDVGENSEVVIDSLSNEIWASHDEVVGAIESSESEVIQNMDEHFEETNGYIQEGMNSQKQIIETMEDTRQEARPVGTFSMTTEDRNSLINAIKESGVPNVHNTSTASNFKSTGVSSAGTFTRKAVSTTTKSNATSTKAATSTKKTTSTTSPSTYNYTTKKGLNTNASIVDALKATGANSSMEARKEIAAANGINNYKGTTAQNTKMLNMMKSGDLVKPTSTKSSGSTKSGSSKSGSSKSSSKKK